MMKVVDMHCDTIFKNFYDDLHHGKRRFFIRKMTVIFDLKEKCKKGDYFTFKNFCDVLSILSEKSSTFFLKSKIKLI